jgi:hypothetical protein
MDVCRGSVEGSQFASAGVLKCWKLKVRYKQEPKRS